MSEKKKREREAKQTFTTKQNWNGIVTRKKKDDEKRERE